MEIKILWGSLLGKFTNFSLSNNCQSIKVKGKDSGRQLDVQSTSGIQCDYREHGIGGAPTEASRLHDPSHPDCHGLLSPRVRPSTFLDCPVMDDSFSSAGNLCLPLPWARSKRLPPAPPPDRRALPGRHHKSGLSGSTCWATAFGQRHL